jgi:hypothetical protein
VANKSATDRGTNPREGRFRFEGTQGRRRARGLFKQPRASSGLLTGEGRNQPEPGWTSLHGSPGELETMRTSAGEGSEMH